MNIEVEETPFPDHISFLTEYSFFKNREINNYDNYLMLSEDDSYNLPFKAWGMYYDLDQCELTESARKKVDELAFLMLKKVITPFTLNDAHIMESLSQKTGVIYDLYKIFERKAKELHAYKEALEDKLRYQVYPPK